MIKTNSDFRIPSTEAKKSLGSPPRIILNTLAIFLLSQLLAAFFVEFFAAIILQRPVDPPVLTYSAAAQFIYIVLAEVMTIGTVIVLIRKHKLSLAAIGWGRRLQSRDFVMAAVGFIVFIISLVIINSILQLLIPGYTTEDTQDVGFKGVSTSTDKTLAFVALVILPPLGEEFLMRGYLYSALRSHWIFIQAALATSLLFGAAHLLTGTEGLLWAAAVNTFVLSLILVYLRERTGALYSCLMVHSLNNVLAFSVYFSA